jgi:hypothetical protein
MAAAPFLEHPAAGGEFVFFLLKSQRLVATSVTAPFIHHGVHGFGSARRARHFHRM